MGFQSALASTMLDRHLIYLTDATWALCPNRRKCDFQSSVPHERSPSGNILAAIRRRVTVWKFASLDRKFLSFDAPQYAATVSLGLHS